MKIKMQLDTRTGSPRTHRRGPRETLYFNDPLQFPSSFSTQTPRLPSRKMRTRTRRIAALLWGKKGRRRGAEGIAEGSTLLVPLGRPFARRREACMIWGKALELCASQRSTLQGWSSVLLDSGGFDINSSLLLRRYRQTGDKHGSHYGVVIFRLACLLSCNSSSTTIAELFLSIAEIR